MSHRYRSRDLPLTLYSQKSQNEKMWLCIIISRTLGIFADNNQQTIKPLFHQKMRSRWRPNANEINTINMKLICPRQAQLSGTQRKPYSTCSRWGSRLVHRGSHWVHRGSHWVHRGSRWVHKAFFRVFYAPTG